mgnify:CR=1 FL=1
MNAGQLVEVHESTPLLLRRAEKQPRAGSQDWGLSASHMTVVTTSGNEPEMHDQEEDAFRD